MEETRNPRKGVTRLTLSLSHLLDRGMEEEAVVGRPAPAALDDDEDDEEGVAGIVVVAPSLAIVGEAVEERVAVVAWRGLAVDSN